MYTQEESTHNYKELKEKLVKFSTTTTVNPYTKNESIRDYDSTECGDGVPVIRLDDGEGEKCDMINHKTMDNVVLLSFGDDVFEGLCQGYKLHHGVLQDSDAVNIPFVYVVGGEQLKPQSCMVKCGDDIW